MITVEDFNSVLQEYGGSNIYHCIDTSLISEDYDYDGIKYDFCEVERETTDTDEYTFKVKVVNGAWTGGYWITDNNDEWLDVTGSYNSNIGVITIITNEPSIKLFLYIHNIAFSFKFERLSWILLNPRFNEIYFGGNSSFQGVKNHQMLIKKLNPNYSIAAYMRVYSEGYNNSRVVSKTASSMEDVYVATIPSYPAYSTLILCETYNSHYNSMYLSRNELNSPIIFKLSTSNLFLGKINHISFLKDSSERSVDSGVVHFGNNDFSFVFNEGFDLDLRYVKNKIIKFKIMLDAKNNFFGWTYDFTLPADYLSVDSVSDLVSECSDGGANIFELGADLTLTDDLTIAHTVNIIGEGHSINLNGHSIIISDGVKFELSDCMLSNGDNAIVQKADSEVVLTGVTFTNCVSSEYSNLGSCICCDIDLDSLDVEDDFKTTLNDCSFFDNQSAILSGGTLVMDGCKLHNTDLNYIDKHNVALLYQSDGTATIRNGIFDIDYTDESLCTNQESIGFAQCLFRLGTSARLNNHSYTDIKDNGLEITSNACHIFAKYYYSSLEECVYTSPILDNEDSAFCYALTGLNKIFKHNVQITKASDNTENTYRKIEW